ncbi:MAG: hypothetical protein HY430_02680 [Candidatus Levybacteria bacterium]|nr:hypothetical protein [Candidatus Levybacteria bacterium]
MENGSGEIPNGAPKAKESTSTGPADDIKRWAGVDRAPGDSAAIRAAEATAAAQRMQQIPDAIAAAHAKKVAEGTAVKPDALARTPHSAPAAQQAGGLRNFIKNFGK